MEKLGTSLKRVECCRHFQAVEGHRGGGHLGGRHFGRASCLGGEGPTGASPAAVIEQSIGASLVAQPQATSVTTLCIVNITIKLHLSSIDPVLGPSRNVSGHHDLAVSRTCSHMTLGHCFPLLLFPANHRSVLLQHC